MHKIENKNLKVIVPNKVQLLINMYCSLIPDLEWSGILFYKLTKNEKLNLEVELLDIQLMDIGTAGHTSYQYDGTMGPKALKYIFSGEGGLIGHIHSHNNMNVFFSGEDISELKDNCKEHAFYLSVIVNNALDIIARGVIKEEVEYTIQKKGMLLYQSQEKTVYGKEIKKDVEYRYYDAEIVKEDADTSFTKEELMEYLSDYKNVYLKRKQSKTSLSTFSLVNNNKKKFKEQKKLNAPNHEAIQISNYSNVLLYLTYSTKKSTSLNSNVALSLDEGLSVNEIVKNFKKALNEFINTGVVDSDALITMHNVVESKLTVYPVIRDGFLRVLSDEISNATKRESKSVDVVLDNIFNNSNLFD